MVAGSQVLVTVVVTAYNYGRFLADALSSILRQEQHAEFEIIVINDASTDNTDQVVRSFKDDRIRYIVHEKNEGIVRSVNEGVREARGRYVARLDADDRYRPYFLSETLAILEARPSVGLVYGDVAAMDPEGRLLEEPWTGIRSRQVHHGTDSEGDEYLSLISDNVIAVPTMIARREAWDRALPIPEGFASGLEDWYVNLRIARDYPVYYRALTLADYRLHGLNMHANPRRDRSIEDTVFATLDEIFSERDRPDQKRRIRRRIYSQAYLRMFDRYFGLGMDRDARRCYLHALARRPQDAIRPGPLRRFAATYLGHTKYERVKMLVRAISNHSARPGAERR